MNALNHSPIKFSLPANLITIHNVISVQSVSCRSHAHRLLPLLDHLYFSITNHQPLFQICITSPVESAPFFIKLTSFCSLTSWSPHPVQITSSQTHSHHLHSHHLSLPRPFTPELKLNILSDSSDIGRILDFQPDYVDTGKCLL